MYVVQESKAGSRLGLRARRLGRTGAITIAVNAVLAAVVAVGVVDEPIGRGSASPGQSEVAFTGLKVPTGVAVDAGGNVYVSYFTDGYPGIGIASRGVVDFGSGVVHAL
jgi:hypothetical protein